MGELRRTVCGFHRVLSAVGRKRPPCNDLAITCRTARHRAQTCCRSQGPACRNSSSAPPPNAPLSPWTVTDTKGTQWRVGDSGVEKAGWAGLACARPWPSPPAARPAPRPAASCPSGAITGSGKRPGCAPSSLTPPLLRSPSRGLCSGDSARGIPGPAAPVAPLAPLLREAPARGPDRAVCPQVPCPRGPCPAVTLTAGQVTHHRQGQRVPR